LAPVVQDAVAAHFEANPVPAGEKGERGADGKDGKDGEQISDEQIAQQVERFFEINPAPAGRDGKDGRDGRDAEMLTEDKIFSQVERYMRQHPVSDGADGLGFDDLSVVYDGGRNITLSFSQGENKKEFTFKLNMMIYQGVFKQGTTYEQGDSVTFGGSVWTAKKDTKERPMEGSDWQLSVKCGRDGKDGQKGDKGEKGQDGRNWEPTKGL
jgi:integrin beta 3